jgi:hypothetical protein
MPAKDKYHDLVVKILQDSGWRILGQQYVLPAPPRYLFLDIYAQSDEGVSALLEVKVFSSASRPPIEHLASAVGKYLLYRTELEEVGFNLPLFLAIPEITYNGVMQEPIPQKLLEHYQIRLMVFSPTQEEILLWT